jgi:pantoate--beta-alanine ligase
MARDLDIPIEVIGCPTVREATGLALSSRNGRLSEAALQQAGALHPILTRLAADLAAGGRFDALCAAAQAEILAAGFDEIEYLSLCAAETLQPLQVAESTARLFVAAWIEGVRLIDNIAVG